jgi:hypothetical protein
MVLQMASIGEESGSLDHMLGKAAEFYEDEVDEMVKGLSSLMEPFIIVILGTSLVASWCRCTCPSSSWARWSSVLDFGLAQPAAGSAALALGPGFAGLAVGSFLNVVVHRLP